jgi:hypothetical protein
LIPAGGASGVSKTRRQDLIIEIMASAAGSGPMLGGDKRSDTIANYGANDKSNRH